MKNIFKKLFKAIKWLLIPNDDALSWLDMNYNIQSSSDRVFGGEKEIALSELLGENYESQPLSQVPYILENRWGQSIILSSDHIETGFVKMKTFWDEIKTFYEPQLLIEKK